MEASTLLFFLKESLVLLTHLPSHTKFWEFFSFTQKLTYLNTHADVFTFIHVYSPFSDQAGDPSSHNKNHSAQPFCRYLPLWCSRITRSNAGEWQFFRAREGTEGRQGHFDGSHNLNTIRCKGKPTLCTISGTHWLLWNQSGISCHHVNRSRIPKYSRRPRSINVPLILHLF